MLAARQAVTLLRTESILPPTRRVAAIRGGMIQSDARTGPRRESADGRHCKTGGRILRADEGCGQLQQNAIRVARYWLRVVGWVPGDLSSRKPKTGNLKQSSRRVPLRLSAIRT